MRAAALPPTSNPASATEDSARRLLWVCGGLLTLAMVFLLVLQYAKYASTFETRSRERYTILAKHWADTIESQLALGLSMAESGSVTHVLTQAQQRTKGLLGIGVLNVHGDVVQSHGLVSTALWQQVHRQTQVRSEGRGGKDSIRVLAFPLNHTFGERAGSLALSYDDAPTRTNTITAFKSLLPWAIGAWGLGLLILARLLPWLKGKPKSSIDIDIDNNDDNIAHEKDAHRNRRLILTLTALLLGLQVVFGWHTVVTLRQIVKDDAPMLTQAFMQTLTPTWEQAMKHHIPLSELQGMESWLNTALQIGPEFAGIRVFKADKAEENNHPNQNPNGKEGRVDAPQEHMLYSTGAFRSDHLHQSHILSSTQDQTATTRWEIELSSTVLAARTRQIVVEFLMVLLASVVIFSEILKSFSQHMHKKVASTALSTTPTIDLSDLRVPLFLFFLASELPRSFLPVWSQDLAQLPLWPQWVETHFINGYQLSQHFSPDVLTSLPISLYLFAFALISPWSGRICARHGARVLLLWGLSCAGLAHVLTMSVHTWSVLCIARVLAGCSVGMVSVAALDFIGRQPGGKAGGMAMYLTAYVGAGIAGAGLGAVLVEQTGISVVFLFGAIVVTWGLVLVLRWLPTPAPAPAIVTPNHAVTTAAPPMSTPPTQKSGGIWALLSHGVIWRLLLWMTFPMQMAQHGLLFYWTPLALAALGEHSSFTGMAMMGYFFAVLVLNQLFARQADHSGQHTQWVALGIALMGGSGVLVGWFYESWALALSVVLIGIAWAMSFPSQGAITLKTIKDHLTGIEPAVAIGSFRTLERITGMLSPLIVAASIAQWGSSRTALGLGICLLVCTGLLYLGHTRLASNRTLSDSR